MDLKEYANVISKGKYIPKDPFAHATMLIDADTDEVKKFNQLLERQILLANINDDKMLRLYQNDIRILTSLFSIVCREPKIEKFFFEQYYSWKGELALTRTKDGLERKMQANVGGGYQPDNLSGFGEDISYQPEHQDYNMIRDLMRQRRSRGNTKWM